MEDLSTVIEAREQLEIFFDQFHQPHNSKGWSFIAQKIAKSGTKVLNETASTTGVQERVTFAPMIKLLTSLIIFVTSHTEEMDPLKREGTPIVARQLMLVEGGVIELCLKILDVPFRVVRSPADRSPTGSTPVARGFHLRARLTMRMLFGCVGLYRHLIRVTS